MGKVKTILVVDDDLDIVEQVSYIVTSLGHQVATAFNRQEAEATLGNMAVDLVIVDMIMEDRHAGCILCRCIKHFHPETAVIMLTSVADLTGLDIPADPAHLHSILQCDAFIHKPVHPRQLRSIVDRLLDQSDHRAMPTRS